LKSDIGANASKRPLVADVPSTCGAAMQTGRVGSYNPGSGMISMISIYAPGICK